jgi:hypothetical protein
MSFTKSQKKKSRRFKSEKQMVLGMGPLFLPNDQKNLRPERQEHDGRSEVVHHQIGKLLPQGHDAKQFSLS